MAEFRLGEATDLLGRTPLVLQAMLIRLPEHWTNANEGPDTWSAFDVMGHLIHGERTDWIPRARMILEHGTAKEFEPFDRFAQFEESRGRTLPELLDEFAQLRSMSLATLGGFGLTAADLERRGRHPAFGEVTLGQLLSTWVVHDFTHISQVARVMAKQYGQAVGPWSEYLSILR